MPYRRTLLFICFIGSSLYLLKPDSEVYPSPSFPLGSSKSVGCDWAEAAPCVQAVLGIEWRAWPQCSSISAAPMQDMVLRVPRQRIVGRGKWCWIFWPTCQHLTKGSNPSGPHPHFMDRQSVLGSSGLFYVQIDRTEEIARFYKCFSWIPFSLFFGLL